MPNGPQYETHPAQELGTAPEASPSDTGFIGHDGLEPRPLIVDRADAFHEWHPLAEASTFLVDRVPQRLQITHLVLAEHDTIAQRDRQGAHRGCARHSSSKIP